MSLIIKTTGIEDYLDSGEANLKALIMGPPSAGKTRSASFWPKPIFADCEKGRMSIADRAVPYAEILKIEDMDALLRMLMVECQKPQAQRKYQTLVIDTLDAYQRVVIQKRLDSERKEALAGWADWGWLDAKMTQFVARLQALPMNIVVNLHTKTAMVGDDDSKLEVTGPKLKGDLKDQIAAEFDLVGLMGTYYEAEGGERVLKRGIRWHADPKIPILKDRSGQLPDWTPVTFSEDDFAGLFAQLTGHLDSLAPSVDLETLQTDALTDVAAVPPMAGGPVASPVVPAATKAPAKKAAAAPAAGPAAGETSPSEAATTPTSVVVPAAPRAAVPPAAKPVIGGASSAPETTAPEPTPEPAVAAQEPSQEMAQAVETATEGLGATVISEAAPAETEAPVEGATDEAAAPAAPAGQPLCGTSSNDGEEGQPGAVAGCGNPVDPDDDMTQIAMFKTRTYLCPADYAAWRAATKK